jgi:hypothetical protein
LQKKILDLILFSEKNRACGGENERTEDILAG